MERYLKKRKHQHQGGVEKKTKCRRSKANAFLHWIKHEGRIRFERVMSTIPMGFHLAHLVKWPEEARDPECTTVPRTFTEMSGPVRLPFGMGVRYIESSLKSNGPYQFSNFIFTCCFYKKRLGDHDWCSHCLSVRYKLPLEPGGRPHHISPEPSYWYEIRRSKSATFSHPNLRDFMFYKSHLFEVDSKVVCDLLQRIQNFRHFMDNMAVSTYYLPKDLCREIATFVFAPPNVEVMVPKVSEEI